MDKKNIKYNNPRLLLCKFSSTGRAVVSKTTGWKFESFNLCNSNVHFLRVAFMTRMVVVVSCHNFPLQEEFDSSPCPLYNRTYKSCIVQEQLSQ